MHVLEKEYQLDPDTQRLVVRSSTYQVSADGVAGEESTSTKSLDIGR
jgi:hypothetical protein